LDKLAELIAEEPEFVSAFLDLPQTEIDDQIFSTLLKIIIRSLENHPEYADLHYHCSCVYHRLGKSEEAIRESEHAVDINPRYVSALIHLAKLYSNTNREQEAIHRLKNAVTHGANYADVHYLLGHLYHKQGFLDHARRHYQRALNLNDKFMAAKEALASLAA
jgi:tetratricopeptide (TPR) repeat protein